MLSLKTDIKPPNVSTKPLLMYKFFLQIHLLFKIILILPKNHKKFVFLESQQQISFVPSVQSWKTTTRHILYVCENSEK